MHIKLRKINNSNQITVNEITAPNNKPKYHSKTYIFHGRLIRILRFLQHQARTQMGPHLGRWGRRRGKREDREKQRKWRSERSMNQLSSAILPNSPRKRKPWRSKQNPAAETLRKQGSIEIFSPSLILSLPRGRETPMISWERQFGASFSWFCFFWLMRWKPVVEKWAWISPYYF